MKPFKPFLRNCRHPSGLVYIGVQACVDAFFVLSEGIGIKRDLGAIFLLFENYFYFN